MYMKKIPKPVLTPEVIKKRGIKEEVICLFQWLMGSALPSDERLLYSIFSTVLLIEQK
jgi:hypothetical protein